MMILELELSYSNKGEQIWWRMCAGALQICLKRDGNEWAKFMAPQHRC